MAPLGFTNPLSKGKEVEYNGKRYTVAQTICGSTVLVDANGNRITVPTRELRNSSIYNVYEQQIAKCKQDINAYEKENRELEVAQDADIKNRSKFANKLSIFRRKHSLGEIFNSEKNSQEYAYIKNNYWCSVFSYTKASNNIQSNLSCIRDLNESIAFYKNFK